MTLTNFPNGLTSNGLQFTAKKFVVDADLSSATWNTAAAHEIAEVTGLVAVRIIAEVNVTGDDTSGDTSTISLGWDGDADGMIAATEVDDLAAGEFWYDTTPTTVADTLANVALDYVLNGTDVGFTIAGEAAVAGTIRFHVWWIALEDDAEVVAGSGGAFS